MQEESRDLSALEAVIPQICDKSHETASDTPSTLEEALSRPDKAMWRAAVDDELNSLMCQETPNGMK
jgi:hypothetical protein